MAEEKKDDQTITVKLTWRTAIIVISAFLGSGGGAAFTLWEAAPTNVEKTSSIEHDRTREQIRALESHIDRNFSQTNKRLDRHGRLLLSLYDEINQLKNTPQHDKPPKKTGKIETQEYARDPKKYAQNESDDEP